MNETKDILTTQSSDIDKMINSFSDFGVSKKQIEKRIQRRYMVKVRELTNETLSDANADIEAMMENYRYYLKTGIDTLLKPVMPQ